MMDRLWVKLILYPTVATCAFFLFLYLALPVDKVEGIVQARLEAMMGHRYNVRFTTFDLSGVSGIEATDVEITSKPPPPNLPKEEKEKIKRVSMVIDRIEIDVALIKSLLGSPEADFEIQLGEGTLKGTYSQVSYEPVAPEPAATAPRRPPRRPARGKPVDTPEDVEEPSEDAAAADADADGEADEEDEEAIGHQIQATFEELPLNAFSVVRATIGLPLNGNLSGDLSALVGAQGELLESDVDLKIARTALGPGQLPPDVAMGFKLENVVRIGDIEIKSHVEKGKLIIDAFQSTGPDLVFQANGNVTLRQPFPLSRARINARFKLDDAFMKNNNLQGVLDFDPRLKSAKAGDWYGVLVDGSLNNLNHRFSSRPAAELDRIKPE